MSKSKKRLQPRPSAALKDSVSRLLRANRELRKQLEEAEIAVRAARNDVRTCKEQANSVINRLRVDRDEFQERLEIANKLLAKYDEKLKDIDAIKQFEIILNRIKKNCN